MTTLSNFTPPSVRYEVILSAVVEFFGVDLRDLLGSSRKQSVTLPRQVLMSKGWCA